MRKKILYTLLFAVPIAATAQTEQPMATIRPSEAKEFHEYASLGNLGDADVKAPDVKNKPVPAFNLETPEGKPLRSADMKGKVLVLDFWATWCGGCRLLTHDLDSLLHKYYGRNDFQMIGMDNREQVSNKYGDPVTYWKAHGYTFPTSKNDNEYYKLVDARAPTLLVVDQKGVVRARWDAWTPSTAKEAAALVDDLLEDREVTINDINTAVNAGNYYSALHWCDQFLAEHPNEILAVAPLKFTILSKRQQRGSAEALTFIKTVIDTIGDYRELGSSILNNKALVTETSTRDEVFDLLVTVTGAAKDYMIYQTLSYNYSKSGNKEQAIKSMEKAIRVARANNVPAQIITSMDKYIKTLQGY